MSKKKRSRTQQLLEQKRQLQQQITSAQSGPSLIGRKDEIKIESSAPEKKEIAPQLPNYQPTGMRRTLVSSLIIILLLAGAYIANGKTSYVKDMGDSIYHSLRLNK